MNAARRMDDASRIRTLASALAFVFAGAALYADGMNAHPRFTQNPSDSLGSPTLDVTVAAASPADTENANNGGQHRREATTTIAWTRPWGNKS
jgi:hypothetical protein